jgi:hypothetical protein
MDCLDLNQSLQLFVLEKLAFWLPTQNNISKPIITSSLFSYSGSILHYLVVPFLRVCLWQAVLGHQSTNQMTRFLSTPKPKMVDPRENLDPQHVSAFVLPEPNIASKETDLIQPHRKTRPLYLSEMQTHIEKALEELLEIPKPFRCEAVSSAIEMLLSTIVDDSRFGDGLVQQGAERILQDEDIVIPVRRPSSYANRGVISTVHEEDLEESELKPQLSIKTEIFNVMELERSGTSESCIVRGDGAALNRSATIYRK